jgi:hypothetical protein
MSINNKRRSKLYSEGLEHGDLNSNGYIADIESDSEIEEEEEEEEDEGVHRKYPIEVHTDSDTESIDSIDTEDWKYDKVQTELYSDSDTESIDSTDTQVGNREEEEDEENRYIITRPTTSQHGRLPRPRLIRQNAIQNLYKGDPSAAVEDNDNRLKPWLRLKNEQLK